MLKTITAENVQKWQPPFPMPACLSKDNTRERHMAAALEAGPHRLPNAGVLPKREDRLSIVGYGPSLIDTWKGIAHPMISTSGAHDFLIERGIVPEFHTDMDPRMHKLDFIRKSHEDVTYVMASVCHPETWKILRHRKVLLWHVINGPETVEWVAKNDPKAQVMVGGSAIGLGAIQVGGRLGFRKFDCYGLDCSKAEGIRHAGPHGGMTAGHEDLLWQVKDRIFVTSKIMLNTACEFMQWVVQYGLDIRVHGSGMLPYMMETGSTGKAYVPNGTPPALRVVPQKVTPGTLITEDYRAQNRTLHDTHTGYGSGGAKYAQLVTDFKRLNACETVLDYGCGKGTLAAQVAFPVAEYDPAIPGKDAKPEPADLVVCTDVLEHIEPECVDAVLDDLERVTAKIGFFAIHLGPALKTLPDGRNTHICDQPPAWWLEKIAQRFEIVKAHEVVVDGKTVGGMLATMKIAELQVLVKRK
jgi:hypothetical protein